MNLAVVRIWSQASSGVLEYSLFSEISNMFTLLLARPFFYDPHIRKRHLDILSPGTCNLDLGQPIDQRKGENLRGLQMNPYKPLNMRKCTIHSPPVITQFWTPHCVWAVLASRVPYDSTAEVNNTQFLGEDAHDKPQFGSSARWAEGITGLTRERKEPGPRNNISSYWRPDEAEAKATVSPAPCQRSI